MTRKPKNESQNAQTDKNEKKTSLNRFLAETGIQKKHMLSKMNTKSKIYQIIINVHVIIISIGICSN